MPVSRKRSATYVALGLEETVAYYNAQESVDGQWYVFIIDENQTIIAHAPNPDLVGKHVSQALGPNSYPTGSAVAASADQDGAWFDYTYPNPASGVVETKHSWVVLHDGITFGSGWYERGPVLRHFVRQHTVPGAKLYSDGHGAYALLDGEFRHRAVAHSVGTYAIGDVSTNGIESFWSMLKRGIVGTYHQVSAKHLQRYVDEFVGRHNLRDADTADQMAAMACGMAGKRLRYATLTGAA